MLHKLTTSLIGAVLGSRILLTIFNILIPIAIYFEAGPVSAVATYFGMFLVISLTMHLKRESDREEAMQEAIGPLIKDMIKDGHGTKSKTTEFDTGDYKGSITAINLDDLPDEIKEMIENQEKNENKNEPTKH